MQPVALMFFQGLLFVFLLFFTLKTKHLNLEKLLARKVLFESFLQHSFGSERWHLAPAKSLSGTSKLPPHKTKKKKPWTTGVACAGTLSPCFSKMQTSASGGFCVCANNAQPLRGTRQAGPGQGKLQSLDPQRPRGHMPAEAPAPALHHPSSRQLHTKEQKNNLPQSQVIFHLSQFSLPAEMENLTDLQTAFKLEKPNTKK